MHAAKWSTFLFIFGSTAWGGVITTGTFTGDGDTVGGPGTAPGTSTTGISFNGTSDAVVNGVTFVAGARIGTTADGIGYTLANVPNTFGTTPTVPPATGTTALLNDFFYGNASATETLTLTGLLPNTTYLLSEYNRAFGPAGSRFVTLSDSQTGNVPLTYDQNALAMSFVRDTFTTGAETSFTLSSLTIAGAGGTTSAESYHNYDFQLGVVVPEPTSVGLIGIGVLGVLARRRKVVVG